MSIDENAARAYVDATNALNAIIAFPGVTESEAAKAKASREDLDAAWKDGVAADFDGRTAQLQLLVARLTRVSDGIVTNPLQQVRNRLNEVIDKAKAVLAELTGLAESAGTPVPGTAATAAAVTASAPSRLHSGLSPTEFVNYCKQFLGRPYIWGADGPDTFDCSGFAQVALGRLGLDPPGDQTANGLYRHFSDPIRGVPVNTADCGCLVFYGKPARVGHVGVCIDATNMIEAGGGDSETTTVEIAQRQNARVRIRPIARRSDIVAIIRPKHLPWDVDTPVPDSSATTGPEYYDVPSGLTSSYAADNVGLTKQLTALNSYYLDYIREAAGQYLIAPAVIAGVGSRESDWGLGLTPEGPRGTGDRKSRQPKPPLRLGRMPPDGLGFGRGLMQIDWDWHEFARSGNWSDPRSNILYGAAEIADNVRRVERETSLIQPSDVLKVALAAYNAGASRVIQCVKSKGISSVDAVTTGQNYSQDVFDRATWFRVQGFSS
jgi:cell wall-associated NlpC family hydrolase